MSKKAYLDKFRRAIPFRELFNPAVVPQYNNNLFKVENEFPDKEKEIVADSDEPKFVTICKTPPLKLEHIRRMRSIQYVAEIEASESSIPKSAGIQIAIIDPKTQKPITPASSSVLAQFLCMNRWLPKKLDWAFPSRFFDEYHELWQHLYGDHEIHVQMRVTRKGQRIKIRDGGLLIDMGRTPDPRPASDKASIVNTLAQEQKALDEANKSNGALVLPQFAPEIFRADALISDDRPLRILSLDGGGVRGLGSLYMLKAVMDKGFPGKEPHQVFHMMGGTSTGGLIAIMLGRLKMSLSSCIEAYINMMGKVFDPDMSLLQKAGNFYNEGAKYQAEEFKKVILELIKTQLKVERPEDVELLDPKEYEEDTCKVVCMAVMGDSVNNKAPVTLRSFTGLGEEANFPKIKLWEAARATSAAPTYFPPVEVDGVKLVDGGLLANNPVGWTWIETKNAFGATRPMDCFLSIGTGIGSNKSVNGLKKVIPGMVSAATNTEAEHIKFKDLIDENAPNYFSKKYYRLNVGTESDNTSNQWPWRAYQKYGGKLPSADQLRAEKDYKAVGALDDVKAVEEFVADTHAAIKEMEPYIAEAAQMLRAHFEVPSREHHDAGYERAYDRVLQRQAIMGVLKPPIFTADQATFIIQSEEEKKANQKRLLEVDAEQKEQDKPKE